MCTICLGHMRHIAMSGKPVGEVNAAEKHCVSGDVVLSPNAWDICHKDIYKGFEVGNGAHKFFKVIICAIKWHYVKIATPIVSCQPSRRSSILFFTIFISYLFAW